MPTSVTARENEMSRRARWGHEREMSFSRESVVTWHTCKTPSDPLSKASPLPSGYSQCEVSEVEDVESERRDLEAEILLACTVLVAPPPSGQTLTFTCILVKHHHCRHHDCKVEHQYQGGGQPQSRLPPPLRRLHRRHKSCTCPDSTPCMWLNHSDQLGPDAPAVVQTGCLQKGFKQPGGGCDKMKMSENMRWGK